MLLLSLVGKSLVAKVALGVAGMSVTGAAVAAETGSLPQPLQQVAYQVAGELGVPAPALAPASEETEPAPAPSPTDIPDLSPSPSESPSATPSEDAEDDGDGPDATGPAAKGLCQSYRSGGSEHSTSRQALVQAAGGVDQLDAYCDGVLAERDAKRAKSPEPSAAPQQGKAVKPAGDATAKSNSGGSKSGGASKAKSGNGKKSEKG